MSEAVGVAEEKAAKRKRAKSAAPSASRRQVLVRRAAKVVAGLVAIPLLLAPLYRFVDPPVTTVMLLKLFVGNGIHKSWQDISDISPHLTRAVIASEDQRFCTHHGIDWVEVQNALDDEDGRFRGASTITMQTVKNLFLWTGRSWFRKALEAPLALYSELFLPKRRIMEIYLNIVEWDEGVYGAEAAAEHYFHVPAAKLSTTQAARLAAVLPSPATRDAAAPGPGTARIARRIAARATVLGDAADCVLK